MIERIDERIKEIEERMQKAQAILEWEDINEFVYGYNASAVMKYRNELQWLRQFRAEFEFYHE